MRLRGVRRSKPRRSSARTRSGHAGVRGWPEAIGPLRRTGVAQAHPHYCVLMPQSAIHLRRVAAPFDSTALASICRIFNRYIPCLSHHELSRTDHRAPPHCYGGGTKSNPWTGSTRPTTTAGANCRGGAGSLLSLRCLGQQSGGQARASSPHRSSTQFHRRPCTRSPHPRRVRRTSHADRAAGPRS
jgi:hypothetical protein